MGLWEGLAGPNVIAQRIATVLFQPAHDKSASASAVFQRVEQAGAAVVSLTPRCSEPAKLRRAFVAPPLVPCRRAGVCARRAG